jgi:hypothetical protein
LGEQAIEQQATKLRECLHGMGRDAKHGAIGLVIDRDHLEFGFPLEDTPPPKQRKGRKRGGK